MRLTLRLNLFGLLIGLTVAAAVGCDNASPPAAGEGPKKPRVVATTTMIGDLVKQIAGERVELIVLMPAGVDPHSFKPSTGDMGEVARADLIFYNGLHLEGKMVEMLEQQLKGKAHAVTRDIPHDRLLAGDGAGGAHDPHVWFDPKLWSMAAAVVDAELRKLDRSRVEHYEAGFDRVTAELAELDSEVSAKLAAIPKERRVLITSHDAFSYFGKAYDIDVRGLQGISTETQAGLSNISAAVDFIVQNKIPAVFVESSVPHATIERVQADCKSRGWDVKIGGELYSDAMGAPGERPGFAVDTYAGMLRYNVDLIVNALK